MKNLIRFIILALFFSLFSQSFALEQAPTPTVLVSGNEASSLGDQINTSLPKAPIQVPQVQAASVLQNKPSNQYQSQILGFQTDINTLFKKITSNLSSIPDSQVGALYLNIKQAQQVNLLLQQQGQLLDQMALMNENLKNIIKQNNILLKSIK